MEKNQKLNLDFGENWSRFIEIIDEERIKAGEDSMKAMLGIESLRDKTFLDAGCGSGLMSLVAVRLGARKVLSFDVNPQCINCANWLKERFSSRPDSWLIKKGDVLDGDYLSQIGKWDIVYSWGVLHHTGKMKKALANVAGLPQDNGLLFISIYNHQRYWTAVHTYLKRTYFKAPRLIKKTMEYGYTAIMTFLWLARDIAFLENPLKRYQEKIKQRGMSIKYDLIDWLRGYPFETAKPEEIFNFFKERGFKLSRLTTQGAGSGCNEFVFQKTG